ncbi:protein phosphatase PTC7 [Diplogelasinospora grovesii]|uniref:Protein phosphatase n=1 Tax=Diplogelasinospora grovesii TaxID=303347 RepID=A0AAN6N0U3_9PEZI|nr:protein phosphatase PTC7 [Diplogelasinospora grovesii]
MRRLPPRFLLSSPPTYTARLRATAALSPPTTEWQRHLLQLLKHPHTPRQQQRRLLNRFARGLSSSSSNKSTNNDGENVKNSTPPASVFDSAVLPKLPFRFDTGIALFAKRAPRPFPPPFLSPPSGSFSDPLSTHHRSRDRRAAYVDGQLIQGFTNGDDAAFASEYFICVNDGVGAWSTRPRGHAGLWARLILHFWATAIFEDMARQGDAYAKPDPIAYLQRAYEQTCEATSAPNDWQGTTTASGAQLHYRAPASGAHQSDSAGKAAEPLLYVTNVGDSQVMVVRPSTRKLVFKSKEQWHWFDCPRQLGTNSPDTPLTDAVVDEVPIQEGDVVLAMSDGVIDNLWTHEIVDNVSQSLERWQAGKVRGRAVTRDDNSDSDKMRYVAQELMEAAKVIALDPFAESPFMEHAIEEGLPSEGGEYSGPLQELLGKYMADYVWHNNRQA